MNINGASSVAARPAVRIEGLSHSFGSHLVLNDINMTVASGEVGC